MLADGIEDFVVGTKVKLDYLIVLVFIKFLLSKKWLLIADYMR